MSLLIKALDKAQEEAQTAKGKQKAKQSEAELALQANNVAKTDGKRQPLSLNPTVTEQSFSLNAASEKMAAANALELELSPTVKVDNNLQQRLSINNQPVVSEDTYAINGHLKPAETDTAKQTNASLPAGSTRKAFEPSKNNTNASAANVFAAKRIEANHQNSKIAFIVGVGVIVLSAIGAYFYQLADTGSDLTFMAKRPVMAAPAPQAEQVKPAEQVQPAEIAPLSDINPSSNAASTDMDSDYAAPQNNADTSQVAPQKLANAQSAINDLRLAQNEKTFDGVDTESQPAKPLKEANQLEADRVNSVQIASKSASIQVSKTTEQAGVNPVLMRAYDAYNAGNDTDAIKLYKQVLQRDVRNVDALLGLGAIAQRQGRLPDANGWYGKVLELDPKNSIALGFNLAAHLDNQAPNDMNNESRIKNMLAKQPDDASLHATLGNFYADSNQWSAAQQAYFDAYRLNASADNAFNLAISLDQLGKPKLALPYYQRALQLSQIGRSNIDKAALEARISAIQ